jgi:hypothetical protein
MDSVHHPPEQIKIPFHTPTKPLEQKLSFILPYPVLHTFVSK